MDVRQRPLAAYLVSSGARENRANFVWPAGSSQLARGFFLELDPPLTEWPATMTAGEPARFQSALRAYDGSGTFFANGSATRHVTLEGREDVYIGGVRYSQCLRLQGVTDIRLGWWLNVQLHEHAWFADEVGLVQRTERLRGVALLVVPFRANYKYEIASAAPGNRELDLRRQGAQSTVTTGSDNNSGLSPASREARRKETETARRWSRLAIQLDRMLPRPRVGGLIVEWAAEAIPSDDPQVSLTAHGRH